MELVTERLILRPLTEDDWEEYLPIHLDPDVMRFLGVRHDPEYARTRFERMKSQWEEQAFGHWATRLKDSGRLIGAIGLLEHNDWTATPYNVEVGWVVAKEFWGQGLATEAGRASVEYAFGQVDIDRLICIVDPKNIASRRVAREARLQSRGRDDLARLRRRMARTGPDAVMPGHEAPASTI